MLRIQLFMKKTIEKSIETSQSYKSYTDLVSKLVSEESTTGNEKTEPFINYTMLNNRRMKRWNKTIKISEEVKEKLAKNENKMTWLALTESWCGDAAHVMPVFNKLAELNDSIDFKVVLRDENEDLMSLFLTDGNKSIPKLIMIDNASGEVINSYGPRPSEATKMVNDYKKEHGKLSLEFKKDLQSWYNNDKGQNTIDDLLKLLEN